MSLENAVSRIAPLCAKFGAQPVEVRLVEARQTDDEYLVRWEKPHLPEDRRYGTHVALLRAAELPDLGEDCLLWGHWDQDDQKSRFDFRTRS